MGKIRVLMDSPPISEEEMNSIMSQLSQPLEDDNTCEDKALSLCPDCDGEGETMVAKLYPNGHTEVMEECALCSGFGDVIIGRGEVKGTKCECGSEAIGSNFHSDWCPRN